MQQANSTTVSLTSTWFIRPGCESEALAGLRKLAEEVQAQEPGTLIYRVHTPFTADARLQALPPAAAHSVVFFEEYRDADAFLAHLNGPAFTGFTQTYGALFVSSHGKPYTTVDFLSQQAGFVRPGRTAAPPAPGNGHPSRMFEIIARDQERALTFYGTVFGWTFVRGSHDFAYVHFGSGSAASMGGIGQMDPAVPGEAPGCRFYLTVEHLETAIARALAAGGWRLMDPTQADGYRFAMITDPEGNEIGLLEPFSAA
ncbi:VOC family protein [Massilia aquatica]|uniref:VOC family protein n=1 Tax=Massilia aquatica TaxID=2609000 RepID=A0ABX0M9D9_9BURK|nr:VOC family protein [Massilia aquatica]NHZ41628.1 VOC family protein [Massilia aquatica]